MSKTLVSLDAIKVFIERKAKTEIQVVDAVNVFVFCSDSKHYLVLFKNRMVDGKVSIEDVLVNNNKLTSKEFSNLIKIEEDLVKPKLTTYIVEVTGERRSVLAVTDYTKEEAFNYAMKLLISEGRKRQALELKIDDLLEVDGDKKNAVLLID